MKKEKGITLVALVITIILLLILAVITIISLTNSGLFENAKLAKEKSDNAEKLQNQTLGEYENKIEKYIDGNTRENNSSSKRTILFDGKAHEGDSLNGPIVNAGANDGTSERTFSDKVIDYDILLIYYEVGNLEYSPCIIDKKDFNKEVLNYIGGFSSDAAKCRTFIKIDTENNKIFFVNKEYSTPRLTCVIGYKI